MAKALYQQIYEKLRTVKAPHPPLDPYQFRAALNATASIAERSRRFAHM